jgi:DNA replication protein DnaC
MPKKQKQQQCPTGGTRERIAQHLQRLGLTGFDIDAHLAWVNQQRPSDVEAAEQLLATAVALKRERSIEWRIKSSGIKDRKTMAAFDWDFQPNLDRRVVKNIFTLEFIEQREDLLLTGKSGTGKSHILKALAIDACAREWVVRYVRCVDLIEHLYAGLADGTYERRMKTWCRPNFLVIDDVGLGQLRRRDDEPTAAHMLFSLIDRRHSNAATAVTSNIKLSAWGKYLGDATLAAAVLDRLAANAIRLDIDGPSYRQHKARLRASAHDWQLPVEGPAITHEEPLTRHEQPSP